LTLLVVYFVPADSVFFILRYVISFIFLAIVPGYCLVTLLFSKKNQLELVEKTVLSVALSFGIAGLVGLILGLSLTVIVLVLAVAAFVIRSRELRELQVKNEPSLSS
jgi:uncharacterized membrane protein